MMQEKIKIYLSNTDDKDKLCIELLQKLDKIQADEIEAIEIIAPANLFLTTNVRLKSRVAKRLLQMRVKFVIRVEQK